MKTWKTGTALALGLAALAVGGTLRTAAVAQGEPAWMTDFGAAQAAARASGKPIFLVFR